MGTTLATIGVDPVKTKKIAEIMFRPLSISGVSSSTIPHRTSTKRILEPDEFEGVREWVSTVSEADTSKIKFAISRYLRATNERSNDDDALVDALIDAVIGLESLFGERSGISFAVSSSVARLLENDETERAKIFEEVRKIYSARSKIVHAQREFSYEVTKKYRDGALFYLAICLKKILKDKVELLPLSATERVKKIALSDD